MSWLANKTSTTSVAAIRLTLAATLTFAPTAAAEQSADEASIIVDRRAEPLAEDEAGPSKAGGDQLEPISQVAEFSPEPAGPEPTDLPPKEGVATDSGDEDAPAKIEEKQPEPETKGDAPNASASDDSSSDLADAYADDRTIAPATFNKVLPGVTTRKQLLQKWGVPVATAATEGGQVLTYEIEPFASIDVLVEENLEQEVVEIIRVTLDEQQEPQPLAKRLRADDVEPVELIDEENGELLGLAYPDKGVMLLLAEADESAAPGTPQLVTHITIGRLNPEAFALRADSRPADAYQKRLGDLTRAIEIDPGCGYAHYLATELYLATGQVKLALESAEAALDSSPEDSAYRLRLAQALIETGDYDKAVLETRAVLDAEPGDSVVKAAALHTMGRLASLGDATISDKAIAFHTMAISVADTLATQPDNKDRRAAKRLLVDAHLAIAMEVSRRNYDRKTEVVAQWIGRASSLAEEMISSDGGSLELRMVVARDALAALANLKPTKDPQPWLDEAEEAARALRESSDDPLMTARVDWLLGESYFHALRVEHTRGEPEKAVLNGRKAIKQLMAGAAMGDIRPSAEQLVGRLYFHLGAVNAVLNNDHEKAVAWYERACPLLTSDAPESKLLVPRRSGEALVSMAVSFWNQDQKDRAVELTISGSELMEQAVQARVLDEKALAIPYGNLATMHRKLGNEQKATEFARMARGARGVATASRSSAPAAAKTQEPAKRSARTSGSTNRSAGKGSGSQSGKTMLR
ncbi:MAG: tetratricopeptide repeat protein [Planctomycetota bacterium]